MVSEDRLFIQRFVKDYSLPINIFDSEMIRYYRNLYDFFPSEVFDEECNIIEKEFDGNVSLWLDKSAKLRDDAIYSVINSESYKIFNGDNSPVSIIAKTLKTITGEKNCYTNETDGKYFLSIDLKKANFQALKLSNVINFDTYEDFIESFGGDDYVKNSKYLRQVIFGKMNPSRTILVERYLTSLIRDKITQKLNSDGLFLYSENSDELVYEHKSKGFVTINNDYVNNIESYIFKELNLNVRVEYVNIKKLWIENCNGNNIDAFVRTNIITGEAKLKKASTTFFPQIYKLWKGLEIDERDLKFYFEGQIATFDSPLIIKK